MVTTLSGTRRKHIQKNSFIKNYYKQGKKYDGRLQLGIRQIKKEIKRKKE